MELKTLREFVYVDVPKVRAMLAQLDDGIVESRTDGDTSKKTTGGGVKGFVGHNVEWGSESSSQKSMADALLPTLESALETEGLLEDVSEQLLDPHFWLSGDVRSELPAGTLVRITRAAICLTRSTLHRRSPTLLLPRLAYRISAWLRRRPIRRHPLCRLRRRRGKEGPTGRWPGPSERFHPPGPIFH